MTRPTSASILFTFYFLLSTTFFLYSFGFVDLNLTLTTQPQLLAAISRLQELVYFHRSLSGYLYLGFVTAIILLYYLLLRGMSRVQTFPWKWVLAIALIYTFAYPPFSHDIFNYLFHSKIIWHYGLNPYTYPPMYFEGDSWLRFMRWIHSTAAYGPGHTLLYSPVYLLGLGKFTLTMFWAKLIPLVAYLFSIVLIGKISRRLQSPSPVLLQLAFALNPFILIDSLANSHNDLVMMVFYLLSALWLLRGSLGSSLLTLFYSVSIKLMSIVFLPAYFLRRYFPAPVLFRITAGLLYLPLLIWLPRFQPWYLVWFYVAMLITRSHRLFIFATLSTLLSLYYYYPFIATGFWLEERSLFSFAIVFAGPLAYLTSASLIRVRR